MKALLTSKLFGNASLLMASRLAGAGLNFLTLLLLARVLGPQEFGIYLIALSLGGIMSVFCTLGFPSIVSRFVSQYLVDSRWDLLIGFIQTGRRYILLAALALAPLASIALFLLFDLPDSYPIPLLIGCATAPFLSFIRFNGALANAFRRVIISYIPELLLRPGFFFSVISLVYLTGVPLTASSAIAIHLVIIAALAIGQAGFLKRFSQNPEPDVEAEFDRRQWHRAAAPLLIVVLFTSFFADLEITILAFLMPADQVAIFNVCFKIALLLAFGLQAVDQLSLPDLADAHAKGDNGRIRAVIARANHLKLWPALAATIMIALFGEHILAAFGPEFRDGHTTLIVLALAQLARAACGPVTQLLSLSGQQHRAIAVFAVSLGILLLANLVLVPAYGMLGAGLSVTIATIAWSSILALMLAHIMGYRTWMLDMIGSRG